MNRILSVLVIFLALTAATFADAQRIGDQQETFTIMMVDNLGAYEIECSIEVSTSLYSDLQYDALYCFQVDGMFLSNTLITSAWNSTYYNLLAYGYAPHVNSHWLDVADDVLVRRYHFTDTPNEYYYVFVSSPVFVIAYTLGGR